MPDLHRKILAGRAVAIGCPKFDDHTEDVERLAAIIKEARPSSLTVVHMEVPCCRGYEVLAQKAIEASGSDLPIDIFVVGRTGEILNSHSSTPSKAIGAQS
jgi:hypothetical protein